MKKPRIWLGAWLLLTGAALMTCVGAGSQAQAQQGVRSQRVGPMGSGSGKSVGYRVTRGPAGRVLPQHFDPEAVEERLEGNPKMPILKEGPFVPLSTGQPAPTQARISSGPRADTDPVAFARNSNPGTVAPNGFKSVIHEPSVAVAGDTVFYTANWFAAKSTNGGQSWTHLSPFTFFPVDAAGDFCCDQVVHSFRFNGQDYIVWILQYLKNGSSENYYRVAWATPAQVATNTWSHALIFSRNVTAAANQWVDYPDVAVSNSHLFLTCNIFNSQDTFQNGLVIRIPLADIVDGGGFSFDFLRTANGSLRLAQNCTDAQFFASHNNTSSVRVFRWAQSDPPANITNASVSVASYNISDYSSLTPDGFDWLNFRVDSRITAGAKTGNELWFAWTAARGSQGGQSRPHPYIATLRVNATNLAKIADGAVFNSSFAWAYPSFGVNSNGEVGIAAVFGGGSFFPTPQYGFLTGTASLTAPTGSAGTHGPSEQKWGDYLTVRPFPNNPKLLAAVNYRLSGGTTGNFVAPQFVVFGRSGDVNGGGTPSLQITQPNGGETWPIGQQVTVGWTSANVTGNVNLELSTNGGSTWSPLVMNTANDGSETVTVPNTPTTQARVRISSVADAAVNDVSDANFTIGTVDSGDAFEPDNTPGQAKVINSGQPQTRSIHVIGDVDFASFTVPSGGASVLAETGGANPGTDDTVLQIRASNGTTVLAENDDISQANRYSRISTTLPAGSYFLRVNRFNDSNTIASYTLTLSLTTGGVSPDAFEPDDDPASAKVLVNRQTQNRNIHAVGNVDIAKFTLSATRIVTITTAGPEGDTILELFNSRGGFIAGNDDISDFNRFSQVKKKLKAGTYFIRVREFSVEGTGNELIPAYTLAMTQKKP